MRERLLYNLNQIQGKITEAAVRGGRDASTVKLVAITKTVSVDEIQVLYDLGLRHFGENRLASAQPKVDALPKDIFWHYIAPIQTRKAGDVVTLFSVADAVDRVKVAENLQRRCEQHDKSLEILIEVNVSGEASKHGFTVAEVPEALKEMGAFDRLRVKGLMTMAPFDAPKQVIRSCFRSLKELTQSSALPECSMGMSNDYEIAVEEGATQVRIGQALFI